MGGAYGPVWFVRSIDGTTYVMSYLPEREGKLKYTRYQPKVDDALINKQINDFAKRYGKLVSVEKGNNLSINTIFNTKKEVLELFFEELGS